MSSDFSVVTKRPRTLKEKIFLVVLALLFLWIAIAWIRFEIYRNAKVNVLYAIAEHLDYSYWDKIAVRKRIPYILQWVRREDLIYTTDSDTQAFKQLVENGQMQKLGITFDSPFPLPEKPNICNNFGDLRVFVRFDDVLDYERSESEKDSLKFPCYTWHGQTSLGWSLYIEYYEISKTNSKIEVNGYVIKKNLVHIYSIEYKAD